MDRTPALDSRSKLMVLNDNSLRTICQKVKELNPKEIHLFKKILEKKTRNKINWQHNWRITVARDNKPPLNLIHHTHNWLIPDKFGATSYQFDILVPF